MKLIIPRELSLSCKLTNNDIIESKKLKEQGYSLRAIGRHFKVDHKTIAYELMSPEDRKKRNKEQVLKGYKKTSKEQAVISVLKSKQRKIKIFGPELYYQSTREYDRTRKEKRNKKN